MPSPASRAIVTVERSPWGSTAAGEPLELFTLSDGSLSVSITTLGAAIVNLLVPGRDGVVADVVLGYKSAAGYEADRKSYFGAVVGRFANRIARGSFTLDGKTHSVPLNNGNNALHGGKEGFDRKVWQARLLDDALEMKLVSPDGDMGFPGELKVAVRYSLSRGRLTLAYTATTSKTTTLNITNHSYFNLAGEASGPVLNQVIRIDADRYTPINAELIPTGELAPVAGTPFDLREPIAIGAHMAEAFPQLEIAHGYDHNFVLNGDTQSTHLAAEVYDPASGRMLHVETTEPGVQFYSGNFLDGEFTGKSGKPYLLHAGFCLETQHFPDSPNQPGFPGTTLRTGETFRSSTTFTFSIHP